MKVEVAVLDSASLIRLMVYVDAWALGCFHSLISTQTFRRALTASVDCCAEIKSARFSYATEPRVWRKMPESDARSVGFFNILAGLTLKKEKSIN